MLVGAWQSEQFFIALAGTYQQADSRRLCLLSWWGGRRDESDGVVTRKAPWRPGGCPHLARAAHPTTDWKGNLLHAEKIGLGSTEYELVEI